MTGLVSRSLNNWLPFTASLDVADTVPSAMLDNLVVAPVVVPSGDTKLAMTVVLSTGVAPGVGCPSSPTSSAL